MAINHKEKLLEPSRVSMLMRILLISGFMPVVAGCPGSAAVPGPAPPRAPFQEEFTCDLTMRWRLPKERESGYRLSSTEIKIVTIYASQSPINFGGVPTFIMDVDPHVLLWQFNYLDPTFWYFRLTATDKDGRESMMSIERSNEQCF